MLILEYERPGDEYEMNLDRFHLVGSHWEKKVIEAGKVRAKDASQGGPEEK